MDLDRIRLNSRRALHRKVGRPSLYYDDPSVPDATPVEAIARVHSNAVKGGDLAGSNRNYAEQQDRAETIIFWDQEVPDPTTGALVVLSDLEGYFVTSVRPQDGEFITAEVVRAFPSDLRGKLTPQGWVVP